MNVSRKLILIIITSVALVTLPTLAGLYYYYQGKLLDKEAKVLQADTDINITNVFRPILQEEAKLNFLSQLLEKDLEAPAESYELQQFDEMMQHDADGVWRSKPETMDNAKSAGIFLPPDLKLDAKQKSFHLRSKKIIDAAAFGLNTYFNNLWLITHDKTEIISDSLTTDFILHMSADTDYTKTAWMTLGDPASNPSREMRWTEPTYDPVPKTWMISAVKPVDVNGVWIGNIGQDMLLQNIFAVLFKKTQRYRGEQFFLLDANGNYLQAGSWQQALEVNPGKFKPDLAQTPLLEKLFKQKPTNSAQVFGEQVNIKGEKYLAFSAMIAPMGWRYYRLVPVQQMLIPIKKLFYSLVAMVLAAGLLTGFLINFSVRRNIVNRLQALSNAVRRHGSGEKNVRAELAGNDEISATARAFDQMVDLLRVREREISLIINNMPGAVSRVDRNLRYVYASDQYATIFGKPINQIVGSTMQETLGEQLFNYEKPYIDRALAGERVRFELQVPVANMGTRSGLVHFIPDFDQNVELDGFIVVAVDITDMRLAEAAQLEASSRLNKIASRLPGLVYQFRLRPDGSTCFPFASEAISRIFKMTEEDVREDASKVFAMIPPEDLEDIMTSIEVSAKDLTPWREEFRLQFKDGTERWMSGNSIPQRELDGSVLWHGFITDITEQKKIEQHLNESEVRWKYALEGAGDAVWDCNEVDQTMYYSKAWKEMLGYSEDEIADSFDEWKSRLHPEDKEATLATAQDCLDGKTTSFVCEYRSRCKDGSYKWVLDRGAVVSRSADGKPLRMIGTVSDISERKKTEQALQESEQRWKFAIEGSGDGVWDVNVQTNEANYSKRWKEMLGFTEEEPMMNREAWISRIHPEDKADVLDAGQAYLAGISNFYVVEYRLRCKNESYKWMLSRGMVVSHDEAGKPLRMIGTQTDITERKNAELILEHMQAELLQSHDRFKDLYEFAPIGYLSVSKHGLITQLNWRASAMLGLDRKNIMNQRIAQFIDDEEKPRWSRMFTAINDLESGEELSFDMKFTLQNGMSFYANLNCIRTDDSDEQAMLRVTLEDITTVKKSQAELRIAATAFESQDGLIITDAECKILKINKAFSDISGYSNDEVIGKNPRIFSAGRHDPAFFEAMWESINKNGRWSGEIWNRRKSGELYPENLTITAVKAEKGVVTNYVGTVTDISQIKAAAEEIQQLAYFDSLTRLPNRRLLMDRLKHALASSARNGRQGAVLFLDLDQFKVLNDSQGHDVGDLLLQQVAVRLSECVREGDTVARLGGDEYVVVLEDLSEDGLEAAAQTEIIANKILTTLNQPYLLGEHDHHSTPSIGIAIFNDHHASIEELLKQADIAMYQAKKAGRNTMRFFNPQMQNSITARVALERELRKALDNDELHLFYQIQVDNLGNPLGAEALIRWIHPERGTVSPAQFIPLAEETGLILPIGSWVLETACTQLKAWHDSPHTRDLTLSINVSAKQFRQVDFVAQVRAAIAKYSIDPMQLKLELTESLLLENIEETIVSMTALGELGVQFSLDDFGTGYSSLQYLKRLPLFQLKIDQSFVRDIVTDSHDRSIVRTIIAMAQSLYLNVIAEGVETEEQRALLLSNGCKRYQGYLFGKPVPIEQFEATLKQVLATV